MSRGEIASSASTSSERRMRAQEWMVLAVCAGFLLGLVLTKTKQQAALDGISLATTVWTGAFAWSLLGRQPGPFTWLLIAGTLVQLLLCAKTLLPIPLPALLLAAVSSVAVVLLYPVGQRRLARATVAALATMVLVFQVHSLW